MGAFTFKLDKLPNARLLDLRANLARASAGSLVDRDPLRAARGLAEIDEELVRRGVSIADLDEPDPTLARLARRAAYDAL